MSARNTFRALITNSSRLDDGGSTKRPLLVGQVALRVIQNRRTGHRVRAGGR
jgi:hypothetical protein